MINSLEIWPLAQSVIGIALLYCFIFVCFNSLRESHTSKLTLNPDLQREVRNYVIELNNKKRKAEEELESSRKDKVAKYHCIIRK